MKKMGFTIEYLDDGTARATLNLKEEEEAQCREIQATEKAQPQPQTTSGQKETEAIKT
jgi:hypothetical protein